MCWRSPQPTSTPTTEEMYNAVDWVVRVTEAEFNDSYGRETTAAPTSNDRYGHTAQGTTLSPPECDGRQWAPFGRDHGDVLARKRSMPTGRGSTTDLPIPIDAVI